MNTGARGVGRGAGSREPGRQLRPYSDAVPRWQNAWWGLLLITFLSIGSCSLPQFVFAAQLPSLFRGVVVVDSSLGVRVVSVEEASQAHQADLRPEDIIVRVNDAEVHSIDEFALVSNSLKGRAVSATVLIFRNGAPVEITLQLYSYPLLQEWHLQFIPDDEIHFAENHIGLNYWIRLGRGFEEAGKIDDALHAYLNALHTIPTDTSTALQVSELFSRASQQRFSEGAIAQGVAALRQALIVLERLFDYPLTSDQLERVRRQLQDTLRALRDYSTQQSPSHTSATHTRHPLLVKTNARQPSAVALQTFV